MTIAKEFAAKLAVALVAVAMVLSAYAPAAQAQTTEELQAMINDLLAQVAALSAQTGQGGTSASGVCPYTWTRSLTMGSTGSDVMKLQQFLNADPDTRVAASGVGSVGAETEYYGALTAAAVSKFQVKYLSEILTPVGLVSPTGYFGPSTMAKANAECVSAPVVVPPVVDDSMDDMDDMDDSMDDDDDSSSKTLSGEASLKDAELDDASDDEVEEGMEDAEAAELTLEFEDGDAEVSRIDVSFDSSDTGVDPWDLLESVSLWVDGDKIAEENADDEDDYLSDDMTIRFSGLDLFAEEDEEVDIVIAVSMQNGIDSDDLGDIDITIDSLRFFDADGVATTEPDPTSGDTATISVVEEGVDDELIVKTSNNDPDGTTLQVEDNSKSDWFTVFVFDLDTDDSVNDIELNEVTVSVDLSSSTFAAIIDDAELVIDGVTIDDYTASTSGLQADLVFDVDGDVTIDAGDRVEAELMLRFKSLDAGNEGITVTAEVTAEDRDDIDAEGADDLSGSQLRGAAQGDTHTLRTAGIDVSKESSSATVTTGDSTGDDYATYVLELEITAFEQDVYIDTDAAVALSYDVETSSGSTTAIETISAVIESTGDEVSGSFEITEGSTETITITVTYNPATANTAARFDLDTINFGATSGANTAQSWTASPTEDYRTKVVTIVD